jgi:hypothetical protein
MEKTSFTDFIMPCRAVPFVTFFWFWQKNVLKKIAYMVYHVS